VRNPEYTELTRLLQSEMNLSFTINPELAVAGEIYRLLRFPSAAKINTVCHGKVELAEIVLLPSQVEDDV
jgi:trk system potassium uptake protein TrkA